MDCSADGVLTMLLRADLMINRKSDARLQLSNEYFAVIESSPHAERDYVELENVYGAHNYIRST